MSRTRTLWMREPFLEQILDGRKTIEVRAGYDNIRRLQVGDRLRLNGRHLADIVRVAHYADFDALVAAEDAVAIAPDLPPGELLDALRSLYPPDKEALGAVALEVVLRRYDAILFDMGYTLVYFDPAVPVIGREALRALGVERTPEQVHAAIDAVWTPLWAEADRSTFAATKAQDAELEIQMARAVLQALDVDTSDTTVSAFLNAQEAWYSRPGVICPYAEVKEVLSALAEQGYRLGIVSNWSWNLRDRVAQAGLDDYFDLVWASAYAGCNKPHPLIFQQALDQMALDAWRTVYVGDSYRHDIAGARAAGIDGVLVARDGRTEGYDCPVIPDLRALFDLLTPPSGLQQAHSAHAATGSAQGLSRCQASMPSTAWRSMRPSISSRSRWPITSDTARKVSSGDLSGKRARVTSHVVRAPARRASRTRPTRRS
jgi:putative hydrolase of the HAD superfamily